MITSRTFITSSVCLLIALGLVQSIHSGHNVEVVEKNMDKFPYEIGYYRGTDIEMNNEVVNELNTDVYIFRRYVEEQGGEITLYIGYYGTRKGGRTGHNPNACYPGSGWSILRQSKKDVSVSVDGETRSIRVNSMEVASRGDLNRLVYHWYQSQGGVVLSSGIDQNMHRFKTRLYHNRNDGAFIRISSPITESFNYTEKRIQEFMKQIFPLIIDQWPKEAEI
jgi:EpsI family protein